MTPIENITTRRSTPRLGLPVPGKEVLKKVWQCALSAPDHGCLRPWRFLTVKGDDRIELGKVFEAAALETDPELPENKRDKLRNAPLRAPMLIIAAAKIIPEHKVPPQEQVVATGCAIQNMQLALHAQGFASMWRTGDMAYHPKVKQALGLDPTDEIVGYLYVGTAEFVPKQRSKPVMEDYVSSWNGASR